MSTNGVGGAHVAVGVGGPVLDDAAHLTSRLVVDPAVGDTVGAAGGSSTSVTLIVHGDGVGAAVVVVGLDGDGIGGRVLAHAAGGRGMRMLGRWTRSRVRPWGLQGAFCRPFWDAGGKTTHHDCGAKRASWAKWGWSLTVTSCRTTNPRPARVRPCSGARHAAALGPGG